MKTISVKIDEAVFKELNIRRGRESFSNYLRGIIEAHLTGQDKLFDNLKPPTTAHEIRALAIYLTEIVKLGNPPTYSHCNDRIKGLFEQLTQRLNGGER